MKKFKLKKVKAETLEGMKGLIDQYLEYRPADDDDALMAASLSQLRDKIYAKLGTWQPSYTVSLTPVEAFGLRIFFTDCINERGSYMGNQLGRIADGIHQYYQ